MSKIFDNYSGQAVDLSNLGTIIRERREALGLTQSRLAQLSGLSRQTLVGLEAGALSDLGFNRVAQVLAVLGLDLDPRPFVTRRPLAAPPAAPTESATATATATPAGSDRPFAAAAFIASTAREPVKAAREPTERSMPPAVMTKVMPRPMMPV